MSEVFKTLNALNVNEHTEKKNGLTYLSWAWAWAEVKKVYPDATYQIRQFEGRPYLYDKNLGYMVMTEMTVEGITHEMWLPVMDGSNKAMKDEAYSYEVKEYQYGKWTGNYTEKWVAPATMFDINTAIMRCLTKNIAMFGLGLYIYAGEDLPEDSEEQKKKSEDAKKDEVEKKRVEESLIDQAKMNTLVEVAHKKGVELPKILERYGINHLEEMTNASWMKAMSALNKMKDV